MRFDKIIPSEPLRPYLQYLVISENWTSETYKVFPSTGLVMGFQYKGDLFTLNNGEVTPLAAAGITGLQDSFKVFQNSPLVGSVLVYFTEMGLAQFSNLPAHELFNQSISLEHLFDKTKVQQTEERLALATSDAARIQIVERFLLSELKNRADDRLVMEAIKRIQAAKGLIKIKTLAADLLISQSPLEKRFRKIVGTTPKKYASIVRFNALQKDLNSSASLTELAYDYQFFDQAHFIKDFKQFTGETPEQFKKKN